MSLKTSKTAKEFSYSSKQVPSESDAKEILAARGLKNPHVVDVCYDLGLSAAEKTGTIPNRFLFQNGISKLLASRKAQAPQLLDPIADEPVIGELSSVAELFCIYDFSVSWREDACPAPEFLRFARSAKRTRLNSASCWGRILRSAAKDAGLHSCQNSTQTRYRRTTRKRKCASGWTILAPSRTTFLLASRASMKSSFMLVWLLTLHLCAPDCRALLISETRKLSAGFIKSYRNYWERKPGQETMLQRLFPEYCISPGSGTQHSFESPMAHLGLIASSAEASSYESATAGNRADVLIQDDVVSNLTVGTETQIERSISTHFLLQKLRESLGSFSVTIGTPWAPNDLYATLLKQAEQGENENALAWLIDPVATLKKEAQHKLTPALLPTLVESDVESYLLPIRMPWRFIRKEILANPTFALSQNFVVFPKDGDAGLRVTFTEEDLKAHLKRRDFFGSTLGAQTVMALDRGYTTQRWSDFSVLTIAKLLPVSARDGAKPKMSVVIFDVKLEKWKQSELEKAIVDMIDLHKPTHFVGERDKGFEALDLAIRKQAMLRGVIFPTYVKWVSTTAVGGQTPLQKATRIKRLESAIAGDTLWWCQGSWDVDAVFKQFLSFDGGIFTRNSARKIDVPDCTSLLYETFGPRILTEEDPEETARRREEAEEDWERAKTRAMHERMFSDSPLPRTQTQSEWERARRGGWSPPPTDPDDNDNGGNNGGSPPMGGGFAILPPGFRGGPRKR